MEVIVRRAAREEILPLRHAVLRPGLPLADAWFDGDDAPDTIHAGAFRAGANVACVSLMARPWRDAGWQLRGMATHPDVRGQRLGARLLRFVEDELRGALLWCNARVESAGFYAHHGWTVESDEFDIPGVGPHVVMRREVPA